MDSSNERERVIKGLESLHERLLDAAKRDSIATLDATIVSDALALLKAQEPVKPKWEKGYAYCGKCGYKLHWIVDLNNFCPNCGQAVKWDA